MQSWQIFLSLSSLCWNLKIHSLLHATYAAYLSVVDFFWHIQHFGDEDCYCEVPESFISSHWRLQTDYNHIFLTVLVVQQTFFITRRMVFEAVTWCFAFSNLSKWPECRAGLMHFKSWGLRYVQLFSCFLQIHMAKLARDHVHCWLVDVVTWPLFCCCKILCTAKM